MSIFTVYLHYLNAFSSSQCSLYSRMVKNTFLKFKSGELHFNVAKETFNPEQALTPHAMISPERIHPFPKAPTRKNTGGRKNEKVQFLLTHQRRMRLKRNLG